MTPRTLRRALLLAAISLTAVAPQAAAQQPSPIEDIEDIPVSATSVRLCWSGDGTEEIDTWTIRRAKGTEAPPADAEPVATQPGDQNCLTSTGMETDDAYTFSIVGTSDAGDTEPAAITVAARRAGNFVLGTAAKLPGSGEYAFPRAVHTQGRTHAIYMKPVPGRRHQGIYASSRGAGGWTEPQLITGEDLLELDMELTANARGTVVAAWNKTGKAPKYRVKRAGASRFGHVRRLPVGRFDALNAIALDRDGALHVLVSRAGGPKGVRYLTNAPGRWRESQIPDSRCRSFVDNDCVRPALLSYDPRSDRVVVVEQHDEVRIASKRADARRFGRLRPVRVANRNNLVATDVARSGRRTTLGLQKPGGSPLYVLSGRRLMAIPGTNRPAGELQVAAHSPNRVQVAWRRTSASWDRDEQGIWTAQLVGRTIRAVRHRTDSAYDRLGSLETDRLGRALVAYRR
jgi:hypothetical protein